MYLVFFFYVNIVISIHKCKKSKVKFETDKLTQNNSNFRDRDPLNMFATDAEFYET